MAILFALLGAIFLMLAVLFVFCVFMEGSTDHAEFCFLAFISGVISWLFLSPGLIYTSYTDVTTIHYAPSEIVRSEVNDSTMITYTKFYSPTLCETNIPKSIVFDKKIITQGEMDNGFSSNRAKLFYTCSDSNIVVTMKITLNIFGEPLIKSLHLNYYSDKELKDIMVLNADDIISIKI